MLSQIQNRKSKIPNPLDACSLPRFVVTLSAADATNGLIRVPLALTGKWVRGTREFAITRPDLEAIVRNFRERQNGEINVDYDHASEMPEVAAGGPVPSAGRIVRLDAPEPHPLFPAPVAEGTQGRGGSRFILYGWYEPTPRARELLRSREYRFISPAIDWTARSKLTGKPQGTTLTSVALTNRPFLEELPQIRLSDPSFQPVEEDESGNRKLEIGNPTPKTRHAKRAAPVSVFHFPVSDQGGPMKHVTLSVADGKIKITHEELNDEFFCEPEDLKVCLTELGVGGEGRAASLAEPAATVSYAQARALLSEAEAQDRFVPAAEVFRAQAEQELDAAVRAGKILPRQREIWQKVALSDLPTFRKLMSTQKPQVPLAPVGLAGPAPADVPTQIKFLAEQRMRERQISFGQALSEIGREQPDLVQQYRRAVSGNE